MTSKGISGGRGQELVGAGTGWNLAAGGSRRPSDSEGHRSLEEGRRSTRIDSLLQAFNAWPGHQAQGSGTKGEASLPSSSSHLPHHDRLQLTTAHDPSASSSVLVLECLRYRITADPISGIGGRPQPSILSHRVLTAVLTSPHTLLLSLLSSSPPSTPRDRGQASNSVVLAQIGGKS